ncbi:hypothetical protein M9458_011103, partial [Cirrhinus mrigala]
MSVLAQGLTSPDPIAVADTQLPPPREKWMKRHRHQAQNIHSSFRQIEKDRRPFCDL